MSRPGILSVIKWLVVGDSENQECVQELQHQSNVQARPHLLFLINLGLGPLSTKTQANIVLSRCIAHVKRFALENKYECINGQGGKLATTDKATLLPAHGLCWLHP